MTLIRRFWAVITGRFRAKQLTARDKRKGKKGREAQRNASARKSVMKRSRYMCVKLGKSPPVKQKIAATALTR
jgi:hypothetical protein